MTCQGPPCQAWLDEHRFNRVIENLLSNALDSLVGRTDGVVSLAWAPVFGGGVEIQVADNGKGIPKRVQKRIFEPFFSQGKARGTGLGMAIVQQIVTEHGGAITVTSQEGQGTTVTLRLPGCPPKNGVEDGSGDATGEFPRAEGAKP
jgi:signal transduction histidine kinase